MTGNFLLKVEFHALSKSILFIFRLWNNCLNYYT